MQYSATGSLHEKDMAYAIPLLNIGTKFKKYESQYKERLITDRCQGDVKRNVGKWGKLQRFIEYGNMYHLHVPNHKLFP